MIRPPSMVSAACVVLAACLSIVGCSDTKPAAPEPAAMSGIDLKPDTSGNGEVPGALASASTLPTIDRRLKSVTSLAAHIQYTSTSGITNNRTQVTGTVFVPKGKAPDGGWPVVVYAHPTTGITSDCAPSLSPNLLGASEPIAALTKAGYIIVVPDYQGLGLDKERHPYLDSTTVGYNVIDSVRAVRRLVPDASDRWLAVGVSQGGQAAWAANELAGSYDAGGLKLLGTVSLSPATDINGFADGAASGTLTKEQQAALPLILSSLANEHPDFQLNDYRRGVVEQRWNSLTSCEGPAIADRAKVIDDISADDLRPDSPQAVDTLRAYLQKRGLPQRPATAPMLVIYGGMDTLTPGSWTDQALEAACGMGDVIDIQFQPDKGHSDIDVTYSFGWINDRFAGVPAANSCESFTAARQAIEQPVAPAGESDYIESDTGETGGGE
jgi:pimeloyl-ACP methyl ester carboxylesterase